MASIADVYVTVLPETGKIADGIKKALLAADSDVRKAAQRWKKIIDAELSGQESEVEVTADTTKARKEIEEVSKDKKIVVEVTADVRDAEKTLEEATVDREAIVEAKAETAKAEAEIDWVARNREVGITVTTKRSGEVKGGMFSMLGPLMDEADKLSAKMGPKMAESGAEMGNQFTDSFTKSAFAAVGSGNLGAVGMAALVPLGVGLAGIASNLSGVIGIIPGVAAGAVTALGTLKLATQGFSEAVENMADPEKFAEALQSLTPAAQQAALAIQSIYTNAIQPLQQQLQETLFAGVSEQLISLTNTLLPAIQPGLNAVAGAFNQMFTNLSTTLQDPTVLAGISDIVDNIALAFTNLAPAVGPFVEALVTLTSVSSSFLPGLADALTRAAEAFSTFITQAAASGDLQSWIQTGLDTLNQMMPLIPAIMEMFSSLGPIAAEILPSLVNMAVAFADMFSSLVPLAPLLQLMPLAFDLLAGAFSATASAADWIVGAIQQIGEVFNWCKQFVQGLWEYIKIFADVISTVLQPVLAPLQQAFETVFGAISAAVEWCWNKMSPIFENIKQGIANVISRINDLISAYNAIPLLPDVSTIALPSSLSSTGSQGAPVPAPLPVAASGQDRSPTRSENRTSRPTAAPAVVPSPGPGGFNVPQPTPKPPGGGGGGGSAAKPEAVSPVPGAPYTYTGFGELNWEALCQLEAGGNWSINTGNGYFGGLQFLQSTWERYGGTQFAERADLADKSDQIKVATAVFNDVGASAWPANGWVLQATPEQLNQAGLTGTGRQSTSAGTSGRGNYSVTGSRGGGGTANRPGLPTSVPQISSTIFGASGSQPAARNAANIVGQLYPEIQTIGGQRQDSMPYHTEGRALDIMIPNYDTPEGKALGDEIKAFFQQNAEALGVEDTIWQDTWQPSGGGAGKKLGREGVTAGHYDHVHVTFGSQAAYNNAQVSLAGVGGGAYDAGYTDGNPMPVRETDPLSMEELGKNLVSGVMEIFGFGDLFKDPTQFGLFKIFKALMGVRPGGEQGGLDNGAGNGSGGGGDFLSGGGGGGGNSLFDFASQFIPGGTGNSIEEDLAAWQPGGGGTAGMSGVPGLGAPEPTAHTDSHDLNVTVQGNMTTDTMPKVQNENLSATRNLPGR